MKFKRTDEDWSDYHSGLTEARRKRYGEVLDGILAGVEEILKKYGEGHEICALVPEGIFATGVIGDNRAYAPIVELVFDELPLDTHHDGMVKRISNAITNRLPVSHVTICLTHRVISVPGLGTQLIVENEHYDEAVTKLRFEGVL